MSTSRARMNRGMAEIEELAAISSRRNAGLVRALVDARALLYAQGILTPLEYAKTRRRILRLARGREKR